MRVCFVGLIAITLVLFFFLTGKPSSPRLFQSQQEQLFAMVEARTPMESGSDTQAPVLSEANAGQSNIGYEFAIFEQDMADIAPGLTASDLATGNAPSSTLVSLSELGGDKVFARELVGQNQRNTTIDVPYETVISVSAVTIALVLLHVIALVVVLLLLAGLMPLLWMEKHKNIRHQQTRLLKYEGHKDYFNF